VTAFSLRRDTDAVANDLVVQIITYTLLHCLANEVKGWVSVDETLWCLDRCPLALSNPTPAPSSASAGSASASSSASAASFAGSSSSPAVKEASPSATAVWRIKVFIFSRVVKACTRILRRAARPQAPARSAPPKPGVTAPAPPALDPAFAFLHGVPSATQLTNLKKNLLATLELAESLLFASPHTFLNLTGANLPTPPTQAEANPNTTASASDGSASTPPSAPAADGIITVVTTDDLDLLARLLSTSMRMLELPDRRQVRLEAPICPLLRLLSNILMRPFAGCAASNFPVRPIRAAPSRLWTDRATYVCVALHRKS
jgi:hypothetical protein